MEYEVKLTRAALEMLQAITDKRIQSKIVERLKSLKADPDLQGKPMIGELAGYRSLRAVGQRFRIIYRIQDEQVIVVVVAVGLRKEGDKRDIYKLAQRLVRLGLTAPPAEPDGD